MSSNVDIRDKILEIIAEEMPELSKVLKMYKDMKNAKTLKDRMLVLCNHGVLDEDVCEEVKKYAPMEIDDNEFKRLIFVKLVQKVIRSLKSR